MNIFRLFLIAGMLFSWTAAGHAETTGGVIHFVGSVVESPCSVEVAGSTANTQCYRNGQHYQGQQTLSHFDVSRKELPLNLGTTEMQWVDQQKKLAVMTVVYR